MKRLIPALVLITSFNFMSYSQLVVNNTTMTPTQLVQNVLVGTGVTVSNVTFNGLPGNTIVPALGSFNGANANVGLLSGLIMATGDAQVAVGPNNIGSSSLGGGGLVLTPDSDLNAVAGANIYDKAILEFDFIPQGDSIKFRYVFGSEEYPEYVNAGYNDAFGFFLSGPGISGPYTNSAINIALIPSTTTPVTIDNVNNGNANSGPCTNCAYYVNNGTGVPAGGPTTIQYDGFTTVLTAVAAVQCGVTYHIKLAIGDAGDNVWDSGVFLEAGSFSSEGMDVQLTTVSGNDTIIEGCTNGAIFSFIRPDTSGSVTVHYDIGGNAINGVDYNPIADSIYFPSGVDTVTLSISPIADGIPEGVDSLVITVYIINACGDSIPRVAVLYIIDPVPLFANAGPDQSVTCPGQSINLNGSGSGGIGVYNYLWSTGSPNQNTTYQPLSSQNIILTVTDGCGQTDTDTMFVTVPPYTPLSASVNNVTVTCPGDPATLTASGFSGGTPPYTMVWSTGGTGNTITVNPLVTTVYTFTLTDNCGLDTTISATVTVPVPAPISVIAPDGEICKESNGTAILNIVTSGGTGSTLVSWNSLTTATVTTDGATGAGVVHSPVDGNYIVYIVDQCGNIGSDTSTITIIPCEITIPNVFSPNGDGANDVFYINNLESHPGSVLTIFNRWGQVLYESSDYKNDWTAPGIPDGVYYYILQLTDGYEPSDYHGFVHLLRTR